MKCNNSRHIENTNLYRSNCKSTKIIKKGLRKTKKRGKIQRYSCKDCKYRFVEDEGFFRMRNHTKKITCAIDLFYRGVSTRKIQQHSKISRNRWLSL